jgi:hypothetical protein
LSTSGSKKVSRSAFHTTQFVNAKHVTAKNIPRTLAFLSIPALFSRGSFTNFEDVGDRAHPLNCATHNRKQTGSFIDIRRLTWKERLLSDSKFLFDKAFRQYQRSLHSLIANAPVPCLDSHISCMRGNLLDFAAITRDIVIVFIG